MTSLLAAVTAVLLAWSGTGLVRRYALARRLLDVPNGRSSHAVPTPRGGGLAIVFAITIVFGIATTLGGTAGEGRVAILLPLLGLLVVAWIGWRDDRVELTPGTRLFAHALGALTLLPLVLSPQPIPQWMGVAAAAWWVFWCISSINVVNFMDGIDGLVGGQAVIFGAHLALLAGDHEPTRILGLVLAGAALGFLGWNWPPARIFMGDVGSGSLGLAVVFGGALLMRANGVGMMTAFLPLFPLFLDALTTLLRRMHRGEPVTQAHRSHLYQRLANGGWGHARVSLLFGAAALIGVGAAQLAVAGLGPAPIAVYIVLITALGVVLDGKSTVAADVPTGASRGRR